MSELSFSIIDNNADFIEKTIQVREAINELEADFKSLSAGAENSIKGIECFVNDLRAQINSTIVVLEKMNLENQTRLGNLQFISSDETNVVQDSRVLSEVSARRELTLAIEEQQGELDDLTAKLLEYEKKLKEAKETQSTFDSGLKKMETELKGVSGIFSVATGTLELFGIKSDFLQDAMQKVQTAIAVTNGLQEINTALNKESALQLNVFGRIKLWWKGLTLQSAAAQGAETVAASAGAVANLGLAGSFRAIGLAIKSIPVFGWIATGISVIVGGYSLLSSKTNEQKEVQNKLNEEVKGFNDSVQDYAAKPIASVEILSNKFRALGDDVEAQKKFIIDNKSAFDELGQSINSVSDAQQLLIENKDKFIKAQIAKATSLAYMDLVEEEAKKYIAAKMKADIWQSKSDAKLPDLKNRKKGMVINTELALQRGNSPMGSDNLTVRKPDVIGSFNDVNPYEKIMEDAEAEMNYGIEQAISQSKIAAELMSGNKSSKENPKENSRVDEFQQRLNGIYENQAEERRRQIEDFNNKNCQAEIDAMDEGSDKKLAQMLFNYDRELEELDREEKELLEQKRKTAEQIFNANEDLEAAKDSKHKRQSFDASGIQLTEDEKEGFKNRGSNIIKRQNQEIQAFFDAEKQAMNEQLAAYGNYEQKRLAIIALGEAKKKGKSEGEQETIDTETNKALAALEKEVNKKTSAFEKLFLNMKNKSIKEMREIATNAQEALDFVKKGDWNAKKGQSLGIGEATFKELHNSPKDIEDIEEKTTAFIEQIDQCDTAISKIGIGFDKLFESGSDSKKLNEALSLIESGLNEVMQTGKFLSSTLSGLGDAFGSEALGKAAEGINIAMDTASAAMSGAKAGAMFGPWGAAAGAAVGLVSSLAGSLAKLHDARHEKSIKKIQDQIEVLEKSYKNLGDSLEKAYSADASKLIEQQNTLLEQQKVLIQNQIAEEKSKKKADAGRIKDWENQIEDINKLIGDNKEKQIDAILGSDVKSAIDDFAQAYADAWAAGDDKAKSSKELVKQMIKQMILEAMKATSSKPMEALRNKLAGFFSDGIISAWEREQIEKDAEALTKELDGKYGWADEYLKGDEEATTQDSTRGGFESMSQETGTELNGRFTALQTSNEEIKNSMLLALGNLSVLCTTASDGNILLTEMRNLAVMSNSHLEDIARYTKPILGFGEKLDKIERNTANL